MLSLWPSRLLVSGVAIVCTGALVPALEGDARHHARSLKYVSPATTTNCSQSTACSGSSNAGSGPGLMSSSAGGTGFVGSTTFAGSSTTAAYGVFGMDNSSTGSYNSGVYGQSTNGVGVTGHSSANYGVIGVSVKGPSGVLGVSSAFTGTIASTPSGPAGVIGATTAGYGIYGQATTGNGVHGKATSGSGVSGSATTGSGVSGSSTGQDGVYGVTSSTTGNGVYGAVSSSTGYTSGVAGSSSSSSDSNGVSGTAQGGTGVYGSATTGIGIFGTSSGTLFGVAGSTSNASGIGVDATNSNSSGGTAVQGVATGSGASATGVFGYLSGSSSAPAGIAVLGEVGGTTNSTATAVAGLTAAANGGAGLLGLGTGEGVEAVGGAAANSSAHPALSVISAGGADSAGVFNAYPSSTALETLEIKSTTGNATLCKAAKETPPCAAGGDVYITGDVYVKGALYTTKGGATPYVVPRSFGGGAVTFYGTAARSARLEEDGEAQLQGGQAYVRLDPNFAATIDLRRPYLVFVTPEGDRAMYVSGRAPAGFFVHEVGGGRSNVPFAYRIVADAMPATTAAEGDDGFPAAHSAFVNPKHVLGGIDATAARDTAIVANLANRPRRP